MSLQIFTDSSANLAERILNERNIGVVPLTVSVGGKEMVCYEPGVPFDASAFYARIRADKKLELKTSMINTEAFLTAFEPHLAAGDDVLYIGISSGISGTYSSAVMAGKALRESYPDRRVAAVDTLGASLGEGMQVLEAADLRDKGQDADQIAAYLNRRRRQIRQYFVVDDLMFLKRGGRLAGSAALAGTIINLKPVLKADEEGRIVLDKKSFGRKRALNLLLEIFDAQYAAAPGNRRVGISHADSAGDAQALAKEIASRRPEAEITIADFEPCTGSHAGPGAVAVFFWGA